MTRPPAAPVGPGAPDPEFAGRDAGFARTGRPEPEPGDLRTLFKGISMPAGLRPLGPLVPVTASFVTEASPAEVHAGLEAEFERLECVANWVEPTVAQTERNGMRGIVTLAAAFAVPETLPGGAPFPHRDLILLCAFTVVFGTLVDQALSALHGGAPPDCDDASHHAPASPARLGRSWRATRGRGEGRRRST